MAARILIAEDNEANLALVDYLLRAAGHETLGAADGAEAVRLARSSRLDLVICDLQMPVLDGYGVLTQLRADPVLSNLPVIALTAFSRTHDRNDALVAGFDGYLSKPIDPEAFVAQIEKYLPPQLRTGGTLRPP
ncbi:MAG: response regulator [Betaproteobacteria bacterium]|jgi:CheY-like chemotaxis protein|nr:MAG: response regulator [Betaproteobacteria bacterium]